MKRYQLVPVSAIGDDEFEGRGRGRGGRGRGGGGKGRRRFWQRRERKSQDDEQGSRGRGQKRDEDERRPSRDQQDEEPRRAKRGRAREEEQEPEEQDEPEETALALAGRKARWPAGYFNRRPAVQAGPNMAVVSNPNCEAQPAVMQLRDGLYLVGEIPKSDLDDEIGILPFLAPMMVRAAKRALSRNEVEQEGKPARGFRLFRRDEDEEADDFGRRRSRRSRRSRRAVEQPPWLPDEEAEEMGFDLE